MFVKSNVLGLSFKMFKITISASIIGLRRRVFEHFHTIDPVSFAIPLGSHNDKNTRQTDIFQPQFWVRGTLKG